MPENRGFMLIAESLTKEYRSGDRLLTVLRDVSFRIPQGEFVAIVGPSGSGKTTLLGLLAGLDTPTRGRVILEGTDLTTLSEDERARVRGDQVGFVFQNFQLIPTLTAIENVQVPLELRAGRKRAMAGTRSDHMIMHVDDGTPVYDAERRYAAQGTPVPTSPATPASPVNTSPAARARELLTRVGLAERLDHFPAQLSGGEQQRVALARAFVNHPAILFADEPTGNLDATTGMRVIELLESINRDSQATIVLVTHDDELANRATRIIRLADGRVISDSTTASQPGSSDAAPSAEHAATLHHELPHHHTQPH
jgi:putative ABC transport system ATP-binding protein